MAEKIDNILQKATVVKCKDYEILKGDKNNPLWIVEVDNDKKVAVDIKEYLALIDGMKKLMKEVFELKLEKAILSEFPIDYDDVKAVVLEEMKHNPDIDLKEVVKKIRTEHPNLFYDVNLDKFL